MECFVKFPLIWTTAAELESCIPCGMHRSCCYFKKFEPDCINPQFPHSCRKHQTAESVEQVIGKHMELEAVCIDALCTVADSRKTKTLLALLDKVFHFAVPAVKPDDMVRLRLHCRYHKSVQGNHLACWFLYLEYHPAGVRP